MQSMSASGRALAAALDAQLVSAVMFVVPIEGGNHPVLYFNDDSSAQPHAQLSILPADRPGRQRDASRNLIRIQAHDAHADAPTLTRTIRAAIDHAPAPPRHAAILRDRLDSRMVRAIAAAAGHPLPANPNAHDRPLVRLEPTSTRLWLSSAPNGNGHRSSTYISPYGDWTVEDLAAVARAVLAPAAVAGIQAA